MQHAGHTSGQPGAQDQQRLAGEVRGQPAALQRLLQAPQQPSQLCSAASRIQLPLPGSGIPSLLQCLSWESALDDAEVSLQHMLGITSHRHMY